MGMRKSKILLGLTIGGFLLSSVAGSNESLANRSLSTGETIKLRSDNTFTDETAKASNNDVYVQFNGKMTEELTVNINNANRTNRSCSIDFNVSLNTSEGVAEDDDPNYFIGYYKDEESYPASLEYKVNTKSGGSYYASTEINKISNHGIGSALGSTSFSSQCDIELPYDCEVDISSIKLINVYRVTIEKDASTGLITNKIPNLKEPRGAICNKGKSFKETKLSTFLDFKINKFSDYLDFTALSLDVTNVGTDVYKTLKSDIYKKNEKKIEDGTVYIRSRLNFGGDTRFVVTNKDGETARLSSIAASVNLTNPTNKTTFLVEGLNTEDISNFEIYGATFSIELFNVTTKKIVPRSEYNARFGYIDLGIHDILNYDGSVGIKKVENPGSTNYSTVFLVTLGIYILVFIAADVAYFFYLKNKDKKSDFKVLKLGDFIKNSILAIICLGSLLFDILYISTRVGDFNNSIAVYNPLDWVIVVLSVIVICLGGYFIKYFYVAIKNANEKKRRDRLNLNKDTSDDGTDLIKISK